MELTFTYLNNLWIGFSVIFNNINDFFLRDVGELVGSFLDDVPVISGFFDFIGSLLSSAYPGATVFEMMLGTFLGVTLTIKIIKFFVGLLK